jgi:transcription antitermination factor NusG
MAAVGSPPAPVPGRIIAAFADATGVGGSHDATLGIDPDPARAAFHDLAAHVNRMVRVADGVFAGREALLTAVHARGSATIEVSVFGRVVQAELPIEALGVGAVA